MRQIQSFASRPSVDFAVRDTSNGHGPMVEVHGEIDAATAEEFATAIDRALGDRRHIDIDFRHTTFVGSAGLAVLIKTYLRLGQVPEAITLREPPPCVRRLLQLTGLAQCFTIHDPARRRG